MAFASSAGLRACSNAQKLHTRSNALAGAAPESSGSATTQAGKGAFAARQISSAPSSNVRLGFSSVTSHPAKASGIDLSPGTPRTPFAGHSATLRTFSLHTSSSVSLPIA